jgi:superfamily II DNA or RNA helicase
MILRPYQDRLVTKAVAALRERGNTLAVAPTGAGKTIMLSELARRYGGKQCVLQHRQELTQQNLTKFKVVNPQARIGLFNADVKSWRGDTTFAMAQTLSRNGNLSTMPSLDMLIIDEAHHAVAESYRRIVGEVLSKNPKCVIAGFTATPARGDGKGLRGVFDNCCDQISLHTLISLGFLVRPRTYICALEGVDEQLKGVRKTRSGEFDMEQVEHIMNVSVHNEAVVREWSKIARNRKTIVFCSTVQHASDVAETFRIAGIRAELVTGDTPDGERAAILKRFDKGDVQVLVNVAVLTEGYDSQPVSCVVMLRPCSYKSTMVQMIGRGLRTVDPAEYPGVVKTDCIIMDFGRSLLVHGDFESKVEFDDKKKLCPQCSGEIPCGTKECPICGYEFPVVERDKGDSAKDEKEIVTNVEMMEVDIMNASPFKWLDLFGSGKVMMASGFEAWCATISPDRQLWTALGKLRTEKDVRQLMLGDKAQCLSAADDFLRMNESDNAAKKNKRWLNELASEKQIEHLKRFGYSDELAFSFTKYSAACTMNFFWNQRLIEKAVFQ